MISFRRLAQSVTVVVAVVMIPLGVATVTVKIPDAAVFVQVFGAGRVPAAHVASLFMITGMTPQPMEPIPQVVSGTT